ncbi:MAG: EAL domain-containing protein, partial [Thermoanaerobaculia bacterium]
PLPDPVERCLREGRVVELPGPAVLVRRDGVEFAVRDSVAPVRDRTGRIAGSVVVFKDVSELRGMERQMRFLARHDALTGLLNRREFERRLGRALELAQEEGSDHALLYLDLDDFKLVNDACGHVAGDELLKQVAAELAAALPSRSALARLGGDEFGVLLEDTTPAEARTLAEAIRAELSRFRFAWEDRVFRLGLSLGLVPIAPDSGGLNQVLSAAEAACYVARERGSDRIHEWQPDDTLVAERSGELQWVQRIPRALEEGRFLLYCQTIQPLSPAATEPLCEILLRLCDEAGELVSPAAFIPAAERYRLVGAIDRWVVRAALAALAGGHVSGDPATCFAINLSGQSLGDEAFLDHVLAELGASGVPPARLLFEVTETAAVANLARARRTIAALRGLGCRFVLDDFGSGLSSFAYLKNLPVDFLKIDGEFVRGMTAGSVERALVASIHQIGHLMGIRTIAESVEDRETLEAVRALGIDYAQGFGIARPEPLPTPSAKG